MFLWIMIMAFTGCGKDPTEVLTGGVWQFQNKTTDSPSESVQSSVELDRLFLEGAILEFYSDGQFLIKLPLLVQPTRGTWTLSGDEMLILEAENQSASIVVILSLTDVLLSYRESFTTAGLTDYTVTTSWSR